MNDINVDLFGKNIKAEPLKINIYADEIQPKECSTTKQKWFYIGIIVESLANPLLDDIVAERYCGNIDKNSAYFIKNDRALHWSEISDADTKNIAERWLKYIMTPDKSRNKFYCYILGINDSLLSKDEFGGKDFTNRYNRFFRSCVLYALKCFFPFRNIVIENIYHEEGPQSQHEYFPWHIINKFSEKQKNIEFNCSKIEFLPKSHRNDKKSNIVQLVDLFMGVTTSIIHGVEDSKATEYRKPLMDLAVPLVQRMIDAPKNRNSNFQYANRIMIAFFPKTKSEPGDRQRLTQQFFTKRDLVYCNKDQDCLPGLYF